MHYRTVFDLQSMPYDYGRFAWLLVIALLGLISFLVSVWLLLRNPSAGTYTTRMAVNSGVFGLVTSVFLAGTIVAATAYHKRYRYLHESIRSGRTDVVESIVTEFTPMPWVGHAEERFCVRGKCFEYSDFDLTGGGFNNTQSHGGPMRSGLAVRVTSVNGTIVRLEIAAQE